jgi:hypothetical protein
MKALRIRLCYCGRVSKKTRGNFGFFTEAGPYPFIHMP